VRVFAGGWGGKGKRSKQGRALLNAGSLVQDNEKSGS